MKTYIERINNKDVLLAMTTDLDKLLYSVPYEQDLIEEIYSVLHIPQKCYIEILVYLDSESSEKEGEKEFEKRVILTGSTLEESLEVLMIGLGNLGHYEACIIIQRYLNGSITQ